MDIKSESLAYWYLRLNGFLTITNFVVHPDRGNSQETDVDVLGVRFPYRAENLARPMKDDGLFARLRGKAWITIAEVKNGLCALNGPWTRPERENIFRVLRSIGAFPKAESKLVANALHENGHYQSQLYQVSLMCIGRESNPEIAKRYPLVPQILWREVLAFIYNRFHEYAREKASHPQWDTSGHHLWKAFEGSRNESDFLQTVRIL